MSIIRSIILVGASLLLLELPAGVADKLRYECSSANGWQFTERRTHVAEGIEEYAIALRRDAPAVPPRFKVRFELPQCDIAHAWSYAGFGAPMPPDWSSTSHTSSALAWGIPVYAFLSPADENRLTVAISEARRRVNATFGNHTQGCLAVGEFEFFTEAEAPISAYELKIRLDSRHIFWSDAVDVASRYLNTCQSQPSAPVPNAALDPVYSSWYGFQQDVDDQRIERECERAVKLGMKTLIVDDGWQTDDRNGGYRFCGDWQPNAKAFPDMKAHIAKVHELGMKYLLWYAVPLVGYDSAAYQQFRGKFLNERQDLKAATLDPRFPEVREHLASVFERALQEWQLDGFKFDFLDMLRFFGTDPAIAENYAGRDYKSLPEATDVMMQEICRRLRRIKPDLLVEFRQSYVGPVIRQFGNIIRAGDCPGDFLINRRRVVDLRLVCGDTAVHSDMLEWHPEDTPEHAARYVLAVMFSAIQYSMLLDRLPESHYRMISHYLKFSQAHREALLKGKFRAHHPEAHYPWVEGGNEREWIIAAYTDDVCVRVPVCREVYILNATASSRLLAELTAAPTSIEVFDVFGRPVKTDIQPIKGLNVIPCPESGYVKLSSENTLDIPQFFAGRFDDTPVK